MKINIVEKPCEVLNPYSLNRLIRKGGMCPAQRDVGWDDDEELNKIQ